MIDRGRSVGVMSMEKPANGFRRVPILTALVLLGIFLALFVYAWRVPLTPGAARPIDRARIIAAGEALARADVSDPESARFRHSFVSTRWAYPVTCGEINYRHRGGGYLGFQRFVVAGPVAQREDELSPVQFARLWSVMCETSE